jgi:hypothetical protein
MKMLSDSAVTKEDLNIVDAKQTKQIIQLRVALAVVFVVNLATTLALYFK